MCQKTRNRSFKMISDWFIYFRVFLDRENRYISITRKTAEFIDLYCSAFSKNDLWLFSRIELFVKKQHETDVTVFDRDVVVKVDFEKAVIKGVGNMLTLRKHVNP